jgi:hypothetical protein
MHPQLGLLNDCGEGDTPHPPARGAQMTRGSADARCPCVEPERASGRAEGAAERERHGRGGEPAEDRHLGKPGDEPPFVAAQVW